MNIKVVAKTIPNATVSELRDIALQVDKYPEFIPCWKEVRIYGRKGNSYCTEQVIAIGLVTKKINTRTEWDDNSIRVRLTGPNENIFKFFRTDWNFVQKENNVLVRVELEWVLYSGPMQTMMQPFIPGIADIAVKAFINRLNNVR